MVGCRSGTGDGCCMEADTMVGCRSDTGDVRCMEADALAGNRRKLAGSTLVRVTGTTLVRVTGTSSSEEEWSVSPEGTSETTSSSTSCQYLMAWLPLNLFERVVGDDGVT